MEKNIVVLTKMLSLFPNKKIIGIIYENKIQKHIFILDNEFSDKETEYLTKIQDKSNFLRIVDINRDFFNFNWDPEINAYGLIIAICSFRTLVLGLSQYSI